MKAIPCSWIGRILLKWPYYSKQPTDLITLSKYPWHFPKKIRTNNPKIYVEPQKTQNCQSNPEDKEQSWRHDPSRLQTILQSYSNQNSMLLTQKQTHRSMVQNREPRNKLMHLRSINLWQRRQKHNGEKTVSSTSGAGKAEQLQVNQQNLNILSHHIQK